MIPTSLFTALLAALSLSATVLASVEAPLGRLGADNKLVKRAHHRRKHHHSKHHTSHKKSSSHKKSAKKTTKKATKTTAKKAAKSSAAKKSSSSKGSSGKAYSGGNNIALAASSSGTGQSSGGEITYYYQTGEVNCEAYNGGKVSDSDYITAVSEYNYYSNSLCGEQVNICYNSKCIDVTIVDSCQGCAKNHFDLSPAAFKALAGSLDAGEITSGITYTLP